MSANRTRVINCSLRANAVVRNEISARLRRRSGVVLDEGGQQAKGVNESDLDKTSRPRSEAVEPREQRDSVVLCQARWSLFLSPPLSLSLPTFISARFSFAHFYLFRLASIRFITTLLSPFPSVALRNADTWTSLDELELEDVILQTLSKSAIQLSFDCSLFEEDSEAPGEYDTAMSLRGNFRGSSDEDN